jgi:hypothetical protein
MSVVLALPPVDGEAQDQAAEDEPGEISREPSLEDRVV